MTQEQDIKKREKCKACVKANDRIASLVADLEHFCQTSWWIASTDANLTDREMPSPQARVLGIGCNPDGVVTESGTLSLAYPDWVCGKE